MLTQEELNKIYVDGPGAAKLLNVTPSQVRFLCSKGRLEGALKVGTSGWLIPRISVEKYKPFKRGAKSIKEKTMDERKLIEKAIKETKQWQDNK